MIHVCKFHGEKDRLRSLMWSVMQLQINLSQAEHGKEKIQDKKIKSNQIFNYYNISEPYDL